MMVGRPSDRTRYGEVRGLRLAWHEWGPLDGPIVLCIHGFLDHGRSFGLLAEHVKPNVRLVALDVRGHGESGWIGAGGYYHLYDYYHDARYVLQALDAAEDVILVGHSMGGSIASGLAAMVGAPIGGLMVLEGLGINEHPLADSPERLRRWSLAQDHPAVVGDVDVRRRARPILASPEAAAERLARWNPRLSSDCALQLAKTSIELSDDGEGWVWRYDPLHRTPAAKPYLLEEAKSLWGAISVPTLSLFGQKGIRPERLYERHQAFADVVTGTVPDAGHNLHHEHPELLAEALHHFLDHRKWVLPQGVDG